VTALQLLSYISAALLVQVVAGISVVTWRWRRLSQSPAAPMTGPGRNDRALAWPGLRDFRVLRRQFEDALRTQCSFHLVPADGAPLPPFQPGQFLTFALDIPDSSGATA